MASFPEDFSDSSVQIKAHSVYQNAGNGSVALKGVLLPFCFDEKSPTFHFLMNAPLFFFLPPTHAELVSLDRKTLHCAE